MEAGGSSEILVTVTSPQSKPSLPWKPQTSHDEDNNNWVSVSYSINECYCIMGVCVMHSVSIINNPDLTSVWTKPLIGELF
jgi:hypothetical protein